MMRMKTKTTGVGPMNGGGRGGAESGGPAEWELRPGGMLVQKRNADADQNSAPAPTIRVRVKYGSTYHEIYISSQASFGTFISLNSFRVSKWHSYYLPIFSAEWN